MADYGVCGRKIITEVTGFKPGDHFDAWCARVYLPEPWLCAVAYGPDERGAVAALMRDEAVVDFSKAVK
jgi:hypothetical protein